MEKVSDKKYIHRHCAEEVREWCRLLDCDEDELDYAIKAVGNLSRWVHRFMKENPAYPEILAEIRTFSKMQAEQAERARVKNS